MTHTRIIVANTYTWNWHQTKEVGMVVGRENLGEVGSIHPLQKRKYKQLAS